METLITNLTVGEFIRKNKISMNETHEPSYYGDFWGEDEFGTSHLSLLDQDGNAVSSTNTINF